MKEKKCQGEEKQKWLACAGACDLQRLIRLCCILTHGCLIFSRALSPVFRDAKASKPPWQAAKVKPLFPFIVKNKATESCGNGNQHEEPSCLPQCWGTVVTSCLTEEWEREVWEGLRDTITLELKCYAWQKYIAHVAGVSLWVYVRSETINQSVNKSLRVPGKCYVNSPHTLTQRPRDEKG